MKTVRAKKYDVVFLISGQSLSFSEDMIQQIKDEQPQAKYVLYQWDSLKNFPYIEKIEPYVTVVTPCEWLSELVKISFLRECRNKWNSDCRRTNS